MGSALPRAGPAGPVTAAARIGPRGLQAAALAAALALAELLWVSGLLQPLDLFIHDGVLGRAGGLEGPARVVVMVIDDRTLERHGWPLPDARLAEAVAALRAAGARVVGIDLYRDRPVPPGAGALAAALGEGGPVVALSKLGSGASPPIEPPEVLRGRQGAYGLADVPVDPDGVVRRLLLYAGEGDAVVPGFALAVAEAFLAGEGIAPAASPADPEALRLGAADLPRLKAGRGPYRGIDTGGYQRLLGYRTRPDDIEQLALDDAVDRPRDLPGLAGRVAIIGTISESVSDRLRLPVGAAGSGALAAGVMLQAIAANDLIAEALGEARAAVAVPQWQVHAASLAIVLVLAALALALPSTAAALGAAGLATLIVGVGVWLAIGARAFLPGSLPLMAALLGAAAIGLARFLILRAEQAELLGAFRAHVSEEVADAIWRERRALGGGGRLSQRLTATVAFADIADSTLVADAMAPQDFGDWIGAFHQRAGATALAHGAFIDKFLGDGIMLVFGAPIPSESGEAQRRDAARAVDCAIAIAAETEALNAGFAAAGLPAMTVRIGIHTGPVFAATIGPAGRQDYTVMGRTPAVAARLEALAKTAGGGGAGRAHVLMSAETARALGQRGDLRPIGRQALKGVATEIEVFELDLSPATGDTGRP